MNNESENRIDLTQFEGIGKWEVEKQPDGSYAIKTGRDNFSLEEAETIAKLPSLIAELKRCYEELDRPKVILIDTDKYEGHTPAPWKHTHIKPNAVVYENFEISFIHAIRGEEIKIADVHLTPDQADGWEFENWKANARLIADAPLLLAEVVRLREQPKVTIDDWDKEGPCVTVYLEGKEYVGILREYDASE